MYNKIQHGAVGLISQPVYGIDNAKELLNSFNKTKENFKDERSSAQLIFGIFPITRLRTAQFLSSHVPGINVPKKWIEALGKAAKISTDEEYKVGMGLSKQLFEDVKKLHPKIHMMTANKFDIASEIIG